MNLKTTYLGLELESPFVPSASPLSEKIDNIRRMEDAGAAAVVLHSLFEEQIEMEAGTLAHYLQQGTESFAEAVSYFPPAGDFHTGPSEYIEHIRKAREAVKIPIIASLNGSSKGGWIDYARQIEKAGASALELNIYQVAADPAVSGAEIEKAVVEIVREVRSAVRLPLAVKIGPYFSSTANMAYRLVEAGANGLVLFNRFYQPDVDLEELEVKPSIYLSTPQTLRLPMRWIAILHGRLKASLAATGGIQNHEDALKLLMVGADVTMMCAALLKHGIDHLKVVRKNMVEWMEAHEYASVAQMKGSMSQKAIAHPAEFERANYMKALTGYDVPTPTPAPSWPRQGRS